jgi:glucose-1-phosphate adenylyltransferase
VTDVRAVLLSGGEGRRMESLGAGRLKPLIPFGGTCRLIDSSLDNAARSGLGEVLLLSQHAEKQLMDDLRRTWWHKGFRVHFGPWNGRYADGVPVALPDRGGEPERGTADALIRKASFIFTPGVRDVLVQHADHVYAFDYRPMIRHHRDSGAALTVSYQRIERRYVHLFGMVEFDTGGNLVRFEEKPAVVSSDLVFAAFCLFDAAILHRYLEQLDGTDWQHDISRDVVPAMLRAGERIVGYPVRGYWADIGTVERYLAAHLAMTDPTVPLRPRLGQLPVTIDPDVARRFVTADGNIRRSVVAADVRVSGRLRCSVAFPGAHIGDGADVSESVLLPGSRVPDGARLHRAIVLEDGTVHEVQPPETKP